MDIYKNRILFNRVKVFLHHQVVTVAWSVEIDKMLLSKVKASIVDKASIKKHILASIKSRHINHYIASKFSK